MFFLGYDCSEFIFYSECLNACSQKKLMSIRAKENNITFQEKVLEKLAGK